MKLSSIADSHFMVLNGTYKDTVFSLLETDYVSDIDDVNYYIDIEFVSIVVDGVILPDDILDKVAHQQFYDDISSIIKSAIENYVGEQECDH